MNYPSGSHIGITGHRPNKLGGYHDISNLSGPIKYKMETFFLEKNAIRVVSGMALGTDQWAVEVALKLGIKVTALLPCIHHEALWPRSSQLHYRELLERIERAGGNVVYVTLKPYETGCMHKRNWEIVNQSHEMLSVWDGTKGGTKDCIKLARGNGLSITNINPRIMEFEQLGESNDEDSE